MNRSLHYTALCAVLGVVLGWIPGLVHGPIAEKWSFYGIAGGTLVWGYAFARMSIGLWVGMTGSPPQWYLRGPLCGALAMLPLGFVALANPMCGAPCMGWNTLSGAAVGFAVGGLAWSITGKHHAGG